MWRILWTAIDTSDASLVQLLRQYLPVRRINYLMQPPRDVYQHQQQPVEQLE